MMKSVRSIFWLLALGLAIVTTGLGASPRVEVFPDLPTAILQSGLDLTGMITIRPVAYRAGVATYRMQEVGGDAEQMVSVAAAHDPRLPPPADAVDEKLDAQRAAELEAFNRLRTQKGFVVTNVNGLSSTTSGWQMMAEPSPSQSWPFGANLPSAVNFGTSLPDKMT